MLGHAPEAARPFWADNVMACHGPRLPRALHGGSFERRDLRLHTDRFPLANIVSHNFPLEKIDEAFQQAEWEGKQTATSRAVITP